MVYYQKGEFLGMNLYDLYYVMIFIAVLLYRIFSFLDTVEYYKKTLEFCHVKRDCKVYNTR